MQAFYMMRVRKLGEYQSYDDRNNNKNGKRKKEKPTSEYTIQQQKWRRQRPLSYTFKLQHITADIPINNFMANSFNLK